MPYIVVTGSLAPTQLLRDDNTVVYGLNREERAAFVTDFNATFKSVIASSVEGERTVKINQKGLTLVVVNRLHALFGYDVISHSMAVTSLNRELASWTMYKKSGLSHKKPHNL